MAIYRAKIAGRRKPVLLKAGNRTEAKDRIVTELDLLTSDELEEALEAGESVWRPGEDLPPDDVEETPAEPGAETDE